MCSICITLVQTLEDQANRTSVFTAKAATMRSIFTVTQRGTIASLDFKSHCHQVGTARLVDLSTLAEIMHFGLRGISTSHCLDHLKIWRTQLLSRDLMFKLILLIGILKSVPETINARMEIASKWN